MTIERTTSDGNKVTRRDLAIFEVSFPSPNQLPHEKGKPKPPVLLTTYYFTTMPRPVTYDGRQYVPIGDADAEKWLGTMGVI